jgi:hypothetical protein
VLSQSVIVDSKGLINSSCRLLRNHDGLGIGSEACVVEAAIGVKVMEGKSGLVRRKRAKLRG